MAFTFEIKQGNAWTAVTAVYPVSIGELLDQRLDEANIVFYSREASYKPTTEARIKFADDDIEYFILANDASAEYPAGSGIYKHEAYIIERLKLFEGIICQSLTFTNALPISSRPIGNRVYATLSGQSGAPMPISSYGGVGSFYSPAPDSIPMVVPTIEEQGTALAQSVEDNNPISVVLDRGSSSLKVFVNGDEYTTITNPNEMLVIPQDVMSGAYEVEIQYSIFLTDTNNINRSFAYFVTFEIDITSISSLRPYSITDCVNRVLELAIPLRRFENPRYTFSGVTYQDGVATIEQGSLADKYDKVRAPEFTLTQSTLLEQLRVIGSYIHAEPYLDENDVVSFIEYGNTEEESIDAPYISNTAVWSINQYCTEIRSNAQNLASSLGYAKGTKIEPAKELYRSVRSEMVYQRINEQNTNASTDEPIYEIDQVLCGVANGNDLISGWAVIGGVTMSPKDITPYIVEYTEYNSNLAQSGFFPYAKNWALYYTQGSKNIEGLFYQPPAAVNNAAIPFAISNILAAVNGLQPQDVQDALTFGPLFTASGAVPANIVFQISYKPISSAFVSHGKQEYVQGEVPYTLVYNQSDNLVETEYYGENMKGVSARLGNIEKERTFILSSRADIPRVGYMLDGYAISAVSCEYYPTYIKCMVGLTKDFNRISEYIGINSVKRMYEVSERQSQERDILLKETLLITRDQNATSDNGTLCQDVSGILGAINKTEYTGDDVARCAYVSTYKKNAAPITPPLLLPVTARSFGNSIHFAFKFKDNYSAGSKTEWISDNDIEGRWQMDVPYTDYYGRAYYLNFLVPKGLASSSDTSIASLAFELPDGTNAPLAEGIIAGTNGVYLRLRKDNREIISLNYELEYKTDDPDLIIGSEFAARCRYINNFDLTECILVGTNTPPNKFIRQAKLENGAPTSTTFTVSGNSLYITLTNDFAGYKYWAICTNTNSVTETYVDEDGGTVTETVQTGHKVLLMGSKEALDSQRSATFYFVIKKQ